MDIVNLADHPSLISELARWHFEEWGRFRPDESLGARTERLRGCCGRKQVPMVLVALVEGRLAGSSMLLAHDMASRPELTPWLGGVYVAAPFRGHGIGSALVGRAEHEAVQLGFNTLYLYTPSQESFYARRGWEALEHCSYMGLNVTLMMKSVV